MFNPRFSTSSVPVTHAEEGLQYIMTPWCGKAVAIMMRSSLRTLNRCPPVVTVCAETLEQQRPLSWKHAVRAGIIFYKFCSLRTPLSICILQVHDFTGMYPSAKRVPGSAESRSDCTAWCIRILWANHADSDSNIQRLHWRDPSDTKYYAGPGVKSWKLKLTENGKHDLICAIFDALVSIFTCYNTMD